MALSELQFIPESSPDARIIEICREMLAIHQEIGALVNRDPYAPDEGPNHEHHETLWEEFSTLEDQLTNAAPPATTEGTRAFAQLAMVFAQRNDEEALVPPESFADWLRLNVLISAAGAPETIPLPR